MASIGQELKRERELRGISLKEIADLTKINIRFLRDLEEDRLENLPGKFLTKSIIRTYAQYMGLDEDAMLNSYLEGTQLQEAASEKEETKNGSLTVIPKKVRNIIYFISLFVILLSILIFFYFILQKDETEVPIQAHQSTAVFQEQKSSPPAIIEPEQEELRLEIYFNQLTWIQVFADGELRLAGNIEPGETFKIVADKEFLIHTGNAGGFHYALNGKQGNPIGPPGSVMRDVRITLDNMDSYISEETRSDPEIKNI
jgi:transcriptional regulator with XRE-family HTH domain